MNINNINIENLPSIFTILGVTGDLAAKKIIPSLWHLFQRGHLPKHLVIIGFSRRKLSDQEFKNLIVESVKKHGDSKIKDKNLNDFFKLFSYHIGTFEDEKTFQSLSNRITEIEQGWGLCTNKLFYLAVPPSSYEPIFKNLAAAKLNLPCGEAGWSRLLIEKPFGTDRLSAEKLQSLLSTYFTEKQIYRIDHYFFKEIIQGIENFRFSNNLFENVWDNSTIERIDIRLNEIIGVEDRGNFYDPIGALRDVGQNHLLAMLAALTMEYSNNKDGVNSVWQNRTKILETLAPWTNKTLQTNTYQAQYQNYQKIRGVHSDSKTETYFAIKTELLHPRWKGVPIFMESGKRMSEARKEIILTLKHPNQCHLCQVGTHASNRIIFRLEPNDEIVIHFWTKKPGFEKAIEERIFSFFLYEKETKVQYVEEYSKIIYATLKGDQTLFVSPDEVLVSWKFIDPIIEGWRQGIVPMMKYEPNTTPTPNIFNQNESNSNKWSKNISSEIGIIGLGKMGANIATRLVSKKWRVIGFNRSPETTKKFEKEGLIGAYSIKEFLEKLSAPRTILLMVTAGKPVDELIFAQNGLAQLLQKGDTIIDGGNSFYKDSIRRGKKLKEKGIHFLDVGISGGPVSIQLGKFAIMAGGDRKIYEKSKSIFEAMSDTTSGYMGTTGAGHFAKMIHNGIEYGMMQALAEGFTILKKAPFKFRLREVAHVYNQNSIITSRLTGWLEQGFKKYGEDLKKASNIVAQTGEGEWTVKTSQELGVSTPVIKDSYLFRLDSKKNPSFTGKILSTLRAVFGGHKI